MERTDTQHSNSRRRRKWDDCERTPQERERLSQRKRLAFGSAILLTGVWWLLDRMDILYVPEFVFTWPVLVMGIGLLNLFIHQFRSSFGFIALAVGAVFFARNELDVPLAIGQYFWPVALIVVGIFILFRPRNRNRFNKWRDRYNDKEGTTVMDESETMDASDTINETVILGGVKKDVLSKAFQGGTITCVAAGCELYLGNADIKNDAVLDVTVVMGGIKLIVPRNWEVVVEATNVMGGTEDSRRMVVDPSAEVKRLVVTGTVLMGGIEIQST